MKTKSYRALALCPLALALAGVVHAETEQANSDTLVSAGVEKLDLSLQLSKDIASKIQSSEKLSLQPGTDKCNQSYTSCSGGYSNFAPTSNSSNTGSPFDPLAI